MGGCFNVDFLEICLINFFKTFLVNIVWIVLNNDYEVDKFTSLYCEYSIVLIRKHQYVVYFRRIYLHAVINLCIGIFSDIQTMSCGSATFTSRSNIMYFTMTI